MAIKNNTELYLVLTKHWFNEILSGRKKQEYRDFTEFYIQRLGVVDKENQLVDTRKYKTVRFQMGYSKNAPQIVVECKGVFIEHDPDAEDELTTDNCNFCIELGEIIEKINI